jgi:hypothetical protein
MNELDANQIWEILRFKILHSKEPDEMIKRLVDDWAQEIHADDYMKAMFRNKLVKLACERRYNESRMRH